MSEESERSSGAGKSPADDPESAEPAAGDPESSEPSAPAGGDVADSPSRFDRLERHSTDGPHNSLQSWTDYVSPVRVAINYAVVWLVRISPSLRLKNWLLRRIGVTVGEGVSWGLEATPDVFWPERITLGDDVIVGYDSVILCHEFLQDEYRLGDVVVGDRAMIGTKAVVLPGVEIGADAQVAANSLVADDVPPGTTVAGVPAEPVDRE